MDQVKVDASLTLDQRRLVQGIINTHAEAKRQAVGALFEANKVVQMQARRLAAAQGEEMRTRNMLRRVLKLSRHKSPCKKHRRDDVCEICIAREYLDDFDSW